LVSDDVYRVSRELAYIVYYVVSARKISQNVNYTQRGTMEGPKAPSEAQPLPSMGVWDIAPRKF